MRRILLVSCALGLLVGLTSTVTAGANEYVNGPGDDPICVQEVTIPEIGAPIYNDRDGGIGVMTSQSTNPPQTTYEVVYAKNCPAAGITRKCNDIWRLSNVVEIAGPDLSAVCALISGS